MSRSEPTDFSGFIEHHLEAIVDGWRSFATTLLPQTEGMSKLVLEDHAREMLLAIAKDMRTRQSERERHLKSTGNAPALDSMLETAAFTHGVGRQLSGFDIGQLVSEFRALRASVLALWRESTLASPPAAVAVEEIARFNEGVDQALAESIQSYSSRVDRSRDIFLAVLGHDVRGPLNSILMGAALLEKPSLPDQLRRDTAQRVGRSADIIKHLANDLLEYARSRLGASIPVERSDCDLEKICREAADLLKAAHPEQVVRVHAFGDLQARCDPVRVLQALGNLLNNAVQHGDRGQPISITVRRDNREIEVAVANRGDQIPADAYERIFEPLQQLSPKTESLEQRSRAGLGLFIVKSIVEGHGGTVAVHSSAEETTFTLRIPVETDAHR